jgi:hypothetical protein
MNSLTAQIDAFTSEGGHPSNREVGDFAAHTQEDKTSAEPVIIDVNRDEAEWTLDLADRLFDYFIVQPAKDEAIKRKVDDKIKRADRKPLRPDAAEEES